LICIPSSSPLSSPENLDTLHAKYLLVGRCYSVLRAWKKNSGAKFSDWIFKFESEAWQSSLMQLKNIRPTYIVPIPQTIRRSWALNGGSSMKVTQWLSCELKTPILPCLEKIPGSKNQASLSHYERRENPLQWKINSDGILLPHQNILLVDDFFTTGKTLSTAAKVLKISGTSEIHGFTLGLRPHL
jgi:predicted amidophosphoribosyltransferase